YLLRTEDVFGNLSQGVTVQVTATEPPPAQLLNLRYSPDMESLTLFWDNVPRAIGYKVYDANKNLIVDTNETSYTAEGLERSKVYRYYVSIMYDHGESELVMIDARTSQRIDFESGNVGFTPKDIIYNSIILIGALSLFILLALVFHF